ncbi:MAG: hypothetical protein LBE65_05050 [Synergistaceae bacterium]|jgi:hypothetical protein|nr:hypothetical protein [Synergistaceae bacterium]
MLKGKNWLQWSVLVVLGVFMLFAGGCGGGGETVDVPPPPPPNGNWIDVADTSWYNETQNNFPIDTPEKLAGLAKLVNGGNNFENKTVYLAKNIDLGGRYWTPIGNHIYAASFRGIFDGQGNTISNIAISIEEIIIEETIVEAMIGFVGNNGGTVTNVRLTDAAISGANDALVYAGGLVGWNRGTITDCTVIDSYISPSGYGCVAGGLVGTNGFDEGAGTITGCEVSNSTISASDPLSNTVATAGGLAGQTGDGGTITDCVVSGGKVTAISRNGYAYSGGFIGIVESSSSSLSGNTTTERPAIGRDERLSPPGPSDNIW